MRGQALSNTRKLNKHWQSGNGGLDIVGGMVTGKPLYSTATVFRGITNAFISYLTYNPETAYFTRYVLQGDTAPTWISTLSVDEAKEIVNGKIGTESYLFWINGNSAKIKFTNKIKDGVKLYATGFMISTGAFTTDVATTGRKYSINKYDLMVDTGDSVTYTASNGTTVSISGTFTTVKIPTNTGSAQAFPTDDVSSLYEETPTVRNAFLLDDGLTIECSFADGDNFFCLGPIYILTNHYDLGQDFWTYDASDNYYHGTMDGKYLMKVTKNG